jgi:SH3-like domain-containing protein
VLGERVTRFKRKNDGRPLELDGQIWHSCAGKLGIERIMMRFGMKLLAVVAAIALPAMADAAGPAVAKKPYWASLSAGQARMRTGPGRQFPASWLYQRAGLPVKVIESYPNWRKVEDPEGAQGWIQSNLISDDRTGMVLRDVQPLRERPDKSANVIWRAEPGVVGKLSECKHGWCKLDVRGRMGYIEAVSLWGVDPNELTP